MELWILFLNALLKLPFGVQCKEQLLQKDMLLCQIAPEALNAPGRAKFSFA